MFTISVEGFRIQESHAEYQVQCSTAYVSRADSCRVWARWKVWRRWSAFLKLEAALRKQYGYQAEGVERLHYKAAAFTGLFSSQDVDPEFLEGRRQALHRLVLSVGEKLEGVRRSLARCLLTYLLAHLLTYLLTTAFSRASAFLTS